MSCWLGGILGSSTNISKSRGFVLAEVERLLLPPEFSEGICLLRQMEGRHMTVVYPIGCERASVPAACGSGF